MGDCADFLVEGGTGFMEGFFVNVGRLLEFLLELFEELDLFLDFLFVGT